MYSHSPRNCELRALRLLDKRKRTLDFYLYECEYNMGAAASTKSKNDDVGIDSECQLEPESNETVVEDMDTVSCHRFGSKSSLQLRSPNASLEEVGVSLVEHEKKQKTSHAPNAVAFHQDKPVVTRARLASKRLGTPFVGSGMSVEPPGRRESITNTKGVDLLQIYEESGNKRKGIKEEVEDRPPSRLARSMKMNNTDILWSGRKDMFTNKPGSNTYADKPTLHHVSNRKPGTTAILNQLGKQGIVSADAATERSIGELRQARMLSNPDEMPYIPSVDAPKRHAPRLAPITNTNNSLTDTMRKPPWERSVLSNDRNYSNKSPFDFNPPLFNSSGKSWSDDVMPLEIRLNTGCRLKVKMMDDSDHG